MEHSYYQIQPKNAKDFPTLTVSLQKKGTQQLSTIQLNSYDILVIRPDEKIVNTAVVSRAIQFGSLVGMSARKAAEYLYHEKEWDKEQIKDFMLKSDATIVNALPKKKDSESPRVSHKKESVKPDETEPIEE